MCRTSGFYYKLYHKAVKTAENIDNIERNRYTLQNMTTLKRNGGDMGKSMISKNILAGILLFFLAGLLIVCPSGLKAQCPVDMRVTSVPVQQLSLADVDLDHFQSRSLLFTIEITNSGSVNATAKLRGALDIHLADGTNFDNAITFTTDPFNVPAPAGRTLTNLNLGSNGDIGFLEFYYSPDAKNRIQDVALSTGSLPAGTYVFHLAMNDILCPTDVKVGDVKLVLQNASRVELRSPQDGATTNEFPLFEFFHDGTKAILTVAELTGDQSREDAISKKPPMLEVELSGQNSFLYSGGRPLERGKTYVWNVVSKSTGIGGVETEISSQLWTFTVSSIAQGAQGLTLLDQIEQILGPKYKSLFDQLKASGYSATGNTTLNGAAISESALLNLLNELRNNDSVELNLE